MDGTEVILVSGLLKGLSLFTMRGICWPMYLRVTLFIVTVLITVSTLAYIFDKINHFQYIQVMGLALLTYSSVWFYYVAMYEGPTDESKGIQGSTDNLNCTKQNESTIIVSTSTNLTSTASDREQHTVIGDQHITLPGTVYLSLETVKSLDLYNQSNDSTEPKT